MTEAERVKRLQEEAKKNAVNGDVGKFLIFPIMYITVVKCRIQVKSSFTLIEIIARMLAYTYWDFNYINKVVLR